MAKARRPAGPAILAMPLLDNAVQMQDLYGFKTAGNNSSVIRTGVHCQPRFMAITPRDERNTMSHVKSMLQAHPKEELGIDQQKLAECIAACLNVRRPARRALMPVSASRRPESWWRASAQTKTVPIFA
ncbi:hypothetical protein GCM10025777_47990 [Membranihabitans marinus]|uniref:Uncharacterized protein n=1 Tax=Nesterenkonia rhizosphaerae TaxID=1348272 RepID=A0ABP9FUW0_9MICC